MQQSTLEGGEGGCGGLGGTGFACSGSAGGTGTTAGASTGLQFTLHQPVYNYSLVIGPVNFPTIAGKEPRWFHRKMQELVLGVRWQSIGCRRAPIGWRCSRNANHSGPCAAHPQGWRKLYWMVRLRSWLQ